MQAHQHLVIHPVKRNLLESFVHIIKKSDCVVRAWDVKSRFDTPNSLREKLLEHFPNDHPDNPQFKVGYFEGRGSTKHWIVEPRDLETMYSFFDSSKIINQGKMSKKIIQIRRSIQT